MTPQAKTSKESILAAAEQAIRETGAFNVTVAAVAQRTGCAKGLVHYHFKTKRALFDKVAHKMAADRRTRWQDALGSATPEEAFRASWRLLTQESTDGTIRAWTSLFTSRDHLPDQTVKSVMAAFSESLGSSVERLFRTVGLAPTVPTAEIGWLLGAVIYGVGLQLEGGAKHQDLEGAFAAAWLGVLSLFK